MSDFAAIALSSAPAHRCSLRRTVHCLTAQKKCWLAIGKWKQIPVFYILKSKFWWHSRPPWPSNPRRCCSMNYEPPSPHFLFFLVIAPMATRGLCHLNVTVSLESLMLLFFMGGQSSRDWHGPSSVDAMHDSVKRHYVSWGSCDLLRQQTISAGYFSMASITNLSLLTI